ncbi:protein inturned [Fopius arisanus]|uniref:Protein inturned n=1 Tax=Fopius arisanus TaxID=64838 RepID=A0A9R1SWN9_9HYME|nr:PREDICTED: protein inturned [Fopius arisanus]
MNGFEMKGTAKPEDRRDGPVSTNESEKPDEDEHSWWASDSGSSTGSYYSDTESSIVEWESEISPTGDVFYIESSPETQNNNDRLYNEQLESPPPELMRRRSTRAGKLMRLIRRRESKRYSSRVKKSKTGSSKNDSGAQQKEGNGNKEVKFQDYQAGEIREVMLWVDPEKRHKLGRRASLCEAFLGISPGDFSDKIRVMVAGFIPDGEAMKNKNIKIGDWLRSINSREVTSTNLEYILSEIAAPTTIKLELQRVAGVEVTTEVPPSMPKQTPLVRRLVDKEESKKLMAALLDYSVGVIYLQTSVLSESGPELQGVTYTYPRSESKSSHSILCSARGAFITLSHMLPETTGSQPISTTISVGSEEIHVLYCLRGDELFLMAIPGRWYSLEESLELIRETARTLEFMFQSLNRCFSNEEHHQVLDHLFCLIFTNLLSFREWGDPLLATGEILPLELPQGRGTCEFEGVIGAAQMVNLPRDAQIQIDAALNEMEAMDYRDWNEDPMDCQRLYTILGSCLYHRSYLLASHLPDDDLIDVHSFLRQNGLLHLVEKESTRSLVLWRTVFPTSCGRGDLGAGVNGKWFLLVVGFGFELLAVVLESGGCTARPAENEGPDVFYVEEAQETLKHIQKIGISTLAAKWIAANARPETLDIQEKNCGKTATIAENLLGFIKPTEIGSIGKAQASPVGSKKIPEVTSILKKRSPEQSPVMSGSVYSLQTSEDSMSQGTGAVSEISDEAAPILGRRATRGRTLTTSRQSDNSDSDVEMYRNDSQTCSMDVSDIRESLLNQAEYIAPTKLTAGDKNCLLHYVHLDILEGVLLSSRTIENPEKNSEIMSTFNECAHSIHRLLKNTVRFKKMLNEDVDKTEINKNLVAIKEHGVLFECESLTFWVIGRLYAAPAKEFYVCYEDTVPQNLVEMAFRLNINWS